MDVIQVKATDVDSTNLTYHFVNSSGEIVQTIGPFSIGEISGLVQLVHAVDYETDQRVYQIEIIVTVSKKGSWFLLFHPLGRVLGSFSFNPPPPPPPPSHELQYINELTSGFTRLSMKTKYVCRGLISLYVNFHKNRTMWLSNLHVRIRRWGEKEKKRSVFVVSGKNRIF